MSLPARYLAYLSQLQFANLFTMNNIRKPGWLLRSLNAERKQPRYHHPGSQRTRQGHNKHLFYLVS